MVMPAFSALAILLGSAAASQAQVTIKNPWVRSTGPGQSATGAFMQLTARQDTNLIAVRSPVAGIVEVHEMRVDNGIMKFTGENADTKNALFNWGVGAVVWLVVGRILDRLVRP